MASPPPPIELRDPADGPPDRARRQAPDLGHVAVERLAIDAELFELLVEQVLGHPVEEQLDRENHDDEVVEPAEDRDVVRDEVAPEDEVAGRSREQRLALAASGRRRTSAQTSRAYIGARLATRQEGRATTRPRASRARPRDRRVASSSCSPLRRRAAIRGGYEPSASIGRASQRPVDAVGSLSIAPAATDWHGSARSRLDIERPFGMMHATRRSRVTRHDAERKVKILDFIAATLRARGYPPSVREIARAVGLAQRPPSITTCRSSSARATSSAAPPSRAPSG